MRISRALAAASILAVAGMALAQPFQLLGGAPLSRMTDKDIALYSAALRKALDEGKNGETHEWSNPETGASGTIQPTRDFARGDSKCRDVFTDTRAKGRREKGTWPFCQEADGSWQIAPQAAGK